MSTNPTVGRTESNLPGATPPLSLRELRERCMDDASVADMILDMFEKQARSDSAEIQRCLAAGDAAQIARTAHALKGAAGAVAAADLVSLARDIEVHAKASRLESVAGTLAALCDEVARCLAYLPAARQGLRSSGGPPARGNAP